MSETLLRRANLVSTIIIAAGLALWVWEPGPPATTVLTAGLLMLMAAPVVRLLAAVVEELRAREWGFAALGVGVLVLLALALEIGRIGR